MLAVLAGVEFVIRAACSFKHPNWLVELQQRLQVQHQFSSESYFGAGPPSATARDYA